MPKDSENKKTWMKQKTEIEIELSETIVYSNRREKFEAYCRSCASNDKPVQGDYTGDGKSDVAFFRPSSGEWFVLRSENQSYYSFPFGISTDVPAPGDYDGDGRFDATVFRPSNTTWFSNRTTAGTLIQTFGIAGDKPVPNAFVP